MTKPRLGIVVRSWLVLLVVFDIDEVEVTPLEFVEDMPAHGSRYVRGAKGFDAVFVNGVMVVERNEYTDTGPCGQIV